MNILEIKKVFKKFGGLTAVHDVTMSIVAGQIHSLIGPNGAGKTTLFNLITRILKPDAGKIIYQKRDLLQIPASRVAILGITRTFQTIELFGDMTVLENVLVGCHTLIPGGIVSTALRLKGFLTDEARAREKSIEALRKVGMEKLWSGRAGSLPIGQRRLLELARALVSGPKLLLLDEPASGLNNRETIELMKIICSLRDQHGMTILVVEHDMRFVMEISDQITVLNHGMKIAEGIPEKIKTDPKVIEAYLGSGTLFMVRENADR